MFLFPLSQAMSKVETPSPVHSSKKGQKKCGLCHSFMFDLDPHPDFLKCLPRSCGVDSPCPLPGHLEEMGAPADRQKSSSSTKGPKGDLVKGVNKAGKVYPAVPSTPKTDSPSRLRTAALVVGFSSFKTEIASLFATLTGRLTASHPRTPILMGPVQKAG